VGAAAFRRAVARLPVSHATFVFAFPGILTTREFRRRRRRRRRRLRGSPNAESPPRPAETLRNARIRKKSRFPRLAAPPRRLPALPRDYPSQTLLRASPGAPRVCPDKTCPADFRQAVNFARYPGSWTGRRGRFLCRFAEPLCGVARGNCTRNAARECCVLVRYARKRNTVSRGRRRDEGI